MREITDFQEAMDFLADIDSTKDMQEYFEVLAWVLKTAKPFVRGMMERGLGIDLAEVERLRLELYFLNNKGEVH